MTSNDAKKLRRAELLELLIEQTEENERLLKRISQLEAKLSERVIVMEKAGSIADAAVGLSGVFAQAQDAADRYLESIRQKQNRAEELLQQAERLMQQTETDCAQCLQKTQEECEKLLQEAEQKAARMDSPASNPSQALPEEKVPAPRGFTSRFMGRR